MRTNKRIANQMQSALLIALLTVGQVPATRAQEAASPKKQSEVASGYKEFLDRVKKYVELHKSIQSTLPKLKPTDEPEVINGHQSALAAKIREARPNAKRGDIFTERATKAFRIATREEFQGPHGHHARTTLWQGEPLTNIHLHVNELYPEGVPFTTVPPTLLLKFPTLPDQVAYRIVGRDLILLDVEANLVVDRIPEIIP